VKTKYAIAKERRQQREERRRLVAYFSAAMAITKDDWRAAVPIVEEHLRRLPQSLERLTDQLRSPDPLINAFEERWGQIGPNRAIPMPPPSDTPPSPACSTEEAEI
jgi:hypothetical protein